MMSIHPLQLQLFWEGFPQGLGVCDSEESWRPLRGWIAVIPNRFHFVIIPLRVDCGIFRSEEISLLDLLHRWHPITVPRWNSLSSWERPILSQMFVETVCMPRCLLLYTCGHGSDWNTWFQLFGWVSEYFWQYSVDWMTPGTNPHYGYNNRSPVSWFQ